MPPPWPLGEIFLANAPTGIAVPEDGAELERLLTRTFERAREPWKDLPLNAADLIAHVARCLSAKDAGRPPEEVLEEMHLSDLYLACACSLGVPRAADALEREHLAKVPGILMRHRYSPETIDDVCQKLREKLLLQTYISNYKGEGKLRSWVEVIAKRAARQEARSLSGESSGWSNIAEQVASTGDLEKEVRQKHLLAEFKSALRAASETLPSQQRQMLKFHYRNGLPGTKLTVLFKVSQPTISRQLRLAREAILVATKRLLRERLDLSEDEFESFIVEIQSRWLDLSLSQLFGDSNEPAAPAEADEGAGPVTDGSAGAKRAALAKRGPS